MRLICLILYRLSKVTIVQYVDFHIGAQDHLLRAGYSLWQKSRRAKAYLLSSSSSLFKRVKPADDDRTTKTATSRMDSLEHPVPILCHLSVVPDLRPQAPPASPLQTSGSALLSDVGFALLFHLGHIAGYPITHTDSIFHRPSQNVHFSTLITVLIPSLLLPWIPAISSFCHLSSK